MDSVFVENLSVKGRHGVKDRERQVEQEFLIDIRAELDTTGAGESDRIEDTADYTRFCEVARNAVEGNSFYLIERIADTIARRILGDDKIRRVTVTIRKPAALQSGTPGVSLTREQL